MHTVLDLISSGVHDAKNQLFLAESLLVRAEAEHGVALDEARYAIELAAQRLSRVLAAYRFERGIGRLSISIVPVSELLEEAALVNRRHCEHLGLTLDVDDHADELRAFDRELVLDILSNALQNASRFARARVLLSAQIEDGFLCLRVEDDGPGFAAAEMDEQSSPGIGLFVARVLALQHVREGRHGRVELRNGGILGGGVFELYLP
ncbi:hypothetical protein J5J83_11930 [Azoarcus sp. L1K30]|uniref:sensor histidine kinase n=1 Tax=Azoarcus sp. L1K30 TaxID=2820277 RepID=UPI001B81DDA2|nr:ATP-binding protein [Azoarcus sp. L1K30]MBR0566822.1 hypothetical protein [Azoarcus sp. L1K30]